MSGAPCPTEVPRVKSTCSPCSVSRQRRPDVGTRTLSVPTGLKSPKRRFQLPGLGAEKASGQVPWSLSSGEWFGTTLAFSLPLGLCWSKEKNRTGNPSSAGRHTQMPNTGPQPKRLISPPFSVLSSPPTHTPTPRKLWMQLPTKNKTASCVYTDDAPLSGPDLARWL